MTCLPLFNELNVIEVENRGRPCKDEFPDTSNGRLKVIVEVNLRVLGVMTTRKDVMVAHSLMWMRIERVEMP